MDFEKIIGQQFTREFERNFGHAQRIKHNINKKYTAENKQTTPKIPLGSTCSVTNHDNEMKF